MSSFMFYVPEPLSSKLKEEVAKTGMLKSEIMRRALAKYLNTDMVVIQYGNPHNNKKNKTSTEQTIQENKHE